MKTKAITTISTIALLSLATNFAAKDSQAILSLPTSPPGLAWTMAEVLGICFAGGTFGIDAAVEGTISPRGALWGISVGALLGGIILDDASGLYRFQPLNSVQAADLDFTHEELNAYNSSLDEINAIFGSVTSDVENQKIERASAHDVWEMNLRQSLDPNAASALDKIAAKLAREIRS